MQVFSSYFFCVKFLSVVILSAQNVVGDPLDTTQILSTTENGLTSREGFENNITEERTTAELRNEATSIIALNTTTSIPIATTTTENINTAIHITSKINKKIMSTIPAVFTTTEPPVTTSTPTASTQADNLTINSVTSTISDTTSTASTTVSTFASTNTSPTSPRTVNDQNTSTMPTTTTPNDSSTSTTSTSDDSTTTTMTATTPTTTSTTEEPCTPLESIDLTINETGKTEVRVKIIAISIGIICPTKMDVICNASEANNTIWQWVVTSRNVTFTLNNTYSDIGLVIGNLSEFTNYSCEVIGHDDYFVYWQFPVHTEQEVPSSPVDLNVTTLSPTSFNITWKEPAKIPSLLEGYGVTVTRTHVASDRHFWNNCSGQASYTWNITNNYLLFDEALADFIYYIEVVAESNVGNSDAVDITARTPAAAPDSPNNVTFNLIEIDNDENIYMTQEISWDMPCNSNGPVTHFQVELDGAYWHNNQSRFDLRNTTVLILGNQTTYSLNFSDIFAASSYIVKIYLVGQMTGIIYKNTFETKDNYPSAPEFDTIITSPYNFTITWKEPDNYPGNISYYTLNVTGIGVNWVKTKYCNISDTADYDIIDYTEDTSYFYDKVAPDATYIITLYAETLRGPGLSANRTVTSSVASPDPLFLLNKTINEFATDNMYNDTATINFQHGCFNGKFDSYIIAFNGIREGYDDHSNSIRFTNYEAEEYTFSLQPEYSYTVNISVFNEQYSTENFVNFRAPAGVPVIDIRDPNTIPIQTETNQVSLSLKQEYFDMSQGHLQFLAIIISDENVTGGSFNRWLNNSQWPTPQGQAGIYYQASDTFWNPFSGGSNTTEYVIGENTTCEDEQYCNKPLESGTQYFVFFRLFNENYYRNTMPISFITEKTTALGMILGILGSLAFLAAAAFIIFILWRKGYIKLNHYERHGYNAAIEDDSDKSDTPLTNSDERLRNRQCIRPPSPAPKTEIAKKNFVAYCKSLERNPALLTAQWTELENQSKIMYDELPHHFATLPENKRKNRYTNILPFDHSRVKIHIDEDDEICSDYINASFITGYSGKNEYIATQGPLHETCRDFWKMILQERVSIIVMVSRFIENNKDKCYRYFPHNRETMTVGDDIEVRCSTELHFGFYCIRTLQVKKELAQVTVTHMQFLEWPDFGVPSGTESMLNFCHQFQERWISEGGMALVHCSAGVGRTGTLIATDILLRVLAAEKKMDVFNTVLELRRERKSMVQTEKQYMYIYQLISSMIEFPIVDEQDNDEHLYENIGGNNNGIVESAL